MNHLFPSLEAAARVMVIQPDFNIDEISFQHLATTYRTTPDKAREVIQIAQNGSRKLPEEIAAVVPVVDGEGGK